MAVHWLQRIHLTNEDAGGSVTLAKYSRKDGWHERPTANLNRSLDALFRDDGAGDARPPTDTFACQFQFPNSKGTPVALDVEYGDVQVPELILRSESVGGEVVLGQFTRAEGWHVPRGVDLTRAVEDLLSAGDFGITTSAHDIELLYVLPQAYATVA